MHDITQLCEGEGEIMQDDDIMRLEQSNTHKFRPIYCDGSSIATEGPGVPSASSVTPGT